MMQKYLVDATWQPRVMQEACRSREQFNLSRTMSDIVDAEPKLAQFLVPGKSQGCPHGTFRLAGGGSFHQFDVYRSIRG